jgi:predicted amidophosphoribosyltransferase
MVGYWEGGVVKDSTVIDYQHSALCWKCNKAYDIESPQCPHCLATNPNVDFVKAMQEALDDE